MKVIENIRDVGIHVGMYLLINWLIDVIFYNNCNIDNKSISLGQLQIFVLFFRVVGGIQEHHKAGLGQQGACHAINFIFFILF